MRIQVLAALALCCRAACARPLTLPVLPGTQAAVNTKPAMFTSQMNWLAQNREALGIPMVLHVGDTIYQILQDYQGQDAGGGYIRLLQIDSEKGTVAARMFSPFYGKAKEDKSKFEFSGVRFIAK